MVAGFRASTQPAFVNSKHETIVNNETSKINYSLKFHWMVNYFKDET
jgi:glutathionyl-hydroquinone reductase